MYMKCNPIYILLQTCSVPFPSKVMEVSCPIRLGLRVFDIVLFLYVDGPLLVDIIVIEVACCPWQVLQRVRFGFRHSKYLKKKRSIAS